MQLGLHVRGTQQAACLAKTNCVLEQRTNHTGRNQIDWKNQETCGPEECNSCRKAVVRARPGNCVGRKQNKQLNKENKDARIVAFLMLEYTETSVRTDDKKFIKDNLYKSNILVNSDLVQKHSENACMSLKITLMLLCRTEKVHIHPCVHGWEKNNQTVQS